MRNLAATSTVLLASLAVLTLSACGPADIPENHAIVREAIEEALVTDEMRAEIPESYNSDGILWHYAERLSPRVADQFLDIIFDHPEDCQAESWIQGLNRYNEEAAFRAGCAAYAEL
jgi:hypothetical protein